MALESREYAFVLIRQLCHETTKCAQRRAFLSSRLNAELTVGKMNRLPPSLLYLVVYNPTLKVDKSIELDDEDAEEQAHVLFYTANDHAVSKDRVLRQVGLAKALGNFTS